MLEPVKGRGADQAAEVRAVVSNLRLNPLEICRLDAGTSSSMDASHVERSTCKQQDHSVLRSTAAPCVRVVTTTPRLHVTGRSARALQAMVPSGRPYSIRRTCCMFSAAAVRAACNAWPYCSRAADVAANTAGICADYLTDGQLNP
nr:hypothetical protein CFP56_04057 [Quercus suber]